jgi:hypothetical protein
LFQRLKLQKDETISNFALKFSLRRYFAAPVVRLAMPASSPGAAAAASAPPSTVWVQGTDLQTADAAAGASDMDATTLFCCFAPTSAAMGGSGARCSPAVAVSSALAACEPSTAVDAGPALLSVDNGRGVYFELLGTDAVGIAASASPAVGPVEAGWYRLAVPKPVLKAPMFSALETRTRMDRFQTLL